jgi:cobalt-zinc-cadmium efflux system outer membrane protein
LPRPWHPEESQPLRAPVHSALLLLAIAFPAAAQDRAAQHPPLAAASPDSLVAQALAASPRIRAAGSRLDAARARIAPAGARSDPMLMAGLQNVPVSSPSLGADEMTMKMVGVSQVLPYPGKLPLARAAAEHEAEAAAVDVESRTPATPRRAPGWRRRT